MVTVICYGKLEQWKSRKAAIVFYSEGACACDGCEALRYYRICEQLRNGCTECVDDNYTPEQLASIKQRYEYVYSKEFDNYMAIPKSAFVADYDSYYGYRICDKFGNRWYLNDKDVSQGVLNLQLIGDYRKIKEYAIQFKLSPDNSVEVVQVEKWWVDAGKTTQRMIVTAPTSLQQFKRICQSAVNVVGALKIRKTFNL